MRKQLYYSFFDGKQSTSGRGRWDKQGEFNGAQDYDFILRCTEKAENVVHIPKGAISLEGS